MGYRFRVQFTAILDTSFEYGSSESDKISETAESDGSHFNPFLPHKQFPEFVLSSTLLLSLRGSAIFSLLKTMHFMLCLPWNEQKRDVCYDTDGEIV